VCIQATFLVHAAIISVALVWSMTVGIQFIEIEELIVNFVVAGYFLTVYLLLQVTMEIRHQTRNGKLISN
jgi:hypothetical protein